MGHDRCTDLKQLVRYIRNSVSHFNVDFGNETGEIRHLEMWNRNPRTNQMDWRADVTVDALRRFAFRLIEDVVNGALQDISSA